MGTQLTLCELAHFYNLPVNLFGLSTKSHSLDAQYGYEAMANVIMARLAGADEIYSMGLLGSSQVLSLEKMVLDNHLARLADEMLQPLLVDEVHLQADLIERVGIGGSYLTQRETRDFTRRGYVPMWPPAGQDVLEIAHDEAPALGIRTRAASEARCERRGRMDDPPGRCGQRRLWAPR